MINSSWGLYKYSCYGDMGVNAVTPLKVDHIEGNTPVFSMNKIKDGEEFVYPTNTYTRNDDKSANQCWSLMFGLKYSF